MAEPLRFSRPARRPMGLAMVGVALGVLLVLIFGVDAHPVIVALFALIISPAIWDVIRGAEATFELGDTHLRWTSGQRGAEIALAEIDEAVLSTTLDFSQRLKLHLSGGRKTRVPPECLPPGRTLDTAFEARGVTHRRSLFGF